MAATRELASAAFRSGGDFGGTFCCLKHFRGGWEHGRAHRRVGGQPVWAPLWPGLISLEGRCEMLASVYYASDLASGSEMIPSLEFMKDPESGSTALCCRSARSHRSFAE